MTRGTAELRRWAELLALTGLAIVQPLLDVLGRSAETFVFRGVAGREIVFFALGVALLPSLALWLVGLASGLLGPGVRRAVHVTTIGALAGVAALVGVRLADLATGPPALFVAAAVGAVVVALYLRVSLTGLFLTYLSPLPLLAAGLFLFSSSVSGLVTGGAVELVEGVESTQPVVMMVLDEFPTAALLDGEGGIDAQQFPNFARLADQSTWYRNYTTHNASTTQAVPSLLTGLLPERGQAPLYTDWPDNLFTLLGGSYEMAVLETVTQLCPPSVCERGGRTVTQRTRVAQEGLGGLVDDSTEVLRQLISLNAEAEVAVDAFTEEVVSVPAPTELGPGGDQVANQPTKFRDFQSSLVDSVEPTLHFVHLILPHGPWRFFPDSTEYESPEMDPEGEIAGVWTARWPAALTQLRLELQAQYTDALLGQTIDRLQATDLWDEALFVVVADHGGAFIPGEPGRALGETNATDVMWTPLFVRSPGQPHGPNDANVQASDLLPTMADLLGVEYPFASDGSSAVGRAADGEPEKLYLRLQNPFQPEPDRLVTIDGPAHLALLLNEPWPRVDVADPVDAFYRRYPLGELVGQPVTEAARGRAGGSAELDQLDALRSGGNGPAAAYLGGTVDASDAGDDVWVVVAIDGVVQGFSPLFPSATSARSFSMLLDQHVVSRDGNEVELFLTDGPGGILRPLTLSDG